MRLRLVVILLCDYSCVFCLLRPCFSPGLRYLLYLAILAYRLLDTDIVNSLTMHSARRQENRRILCINCNICVNTIRRHRVLELNTRVISLLSEWISPVIATEEDYLCESCNEILMRTVNQQLATGCVDAHASGSNVTRQSMSSSRRGHKLACIICGRSLISRQSHLVLNENQSEMQRQISTVVQSRIVPRQVNTSDRICHPCWLSCKRAIVHAQQVDVAHEVHQQQNEEEEVDEHGTEEHPDVEFASVIHEQVVEEQAVEGPSVIILENYRRAANTASHCIFPMCPNDTLHNMSDLFRAIILSTYKYYIPVHCRVCTEHLYSNEWNSLYTSDNSVNTFTVQHVEHVFSFVNATKPHLDFSSVETINEIEDSLFFFWTGKTKQQFFTLLNEVPRIQETHRGIFGLAILLIKLRTGESDDRISTLLEVPRRTLEWLMNKVQEILLQDFVPSNLGLTHMQRNQLMQRNLTIPNGLFNTSGANSIIICDGTYIYVNKSANYAFQKDTYSLHKYKNLLKPFLFVACDGYILECFGPYKATTSDADIMKSLFQNENAPLRSYFQENDIFILDRGFRDSISLLEGCNYKPYMPRSLSEGEHQLTTQQANESRCVTLCRSHITLCRWVVEAVNGQFKRDFKLFRQEYFNKTIPHMMGNFQIAASLLNRFGVRFQDRTEANEIVEIVRQRINYENNLSNLVEELNFNRRSANFQSLTADRNNLIIFPRMTYRDLILFALGTYQIRQARSYYGEHIRFHGEYRIEVSRLTEDFSEYNLRGSGDTSIIRGKIKSRHISRKIYYVYLLIENNVSGCEGIVEYCCNCLVGRRTIGCCAHVMTLVWYLGWARYEENICAPAEFLDDVMIRDDE